MEPEQSSLRLMEYQFEISEIKNLNYLIPNGQEMETDLKLEIEEDFSKDIKRAESTGTNLKILFQFCFVLLREQPNLA